MTLCKFWRGGVLIVAVLAATVGRAEDAPQPAAAPRMTSAELGAWIDQQFAAEWAQSAMEVPAVVDDETFLRRVYLDLTGAIPSVSQARDFLEYSGPHDRGLLVDRLLSETRRPEKYAERTASHWANLWRRMMVPGTTAQAQMAQSLEPWLKEQFAKNVPYDEFARNVITATNAGPEIMAAPTLAPVASAQPAVFYQALGGKPETAASAVTRVFLGTRIGCAECHDHPFASWKQKDFWGMAAFFAGIKDGVVGDTPTASIRPANGDVDYTAAYLDGQAFQPAPGRTPRAALADWIVSPGNKQFAATAVNRVWLYLLGRGMTEAVDDLDLASAAERRVLDDLAGLFVKSGYDLRWLIAGICKSEVYQRECFRSEATAAEPPTGVRLVKSLTPEQVFDSLEQALALPVSRADGSPRFNGQRSELISRMNEAASNNPGEFRAGIPQALLLMNGPLTAAATDLNESRTLRGVIEAPFLSTDDKLDTLFLAAFTRRPTLREREFLLDRVKQPGDGEPQEDAFAEVFWGMLNSPEFVLER